LTGTWYLARTGAGIVVRRIKRCSKAEMKRRNGLKTTVAETLGMIGDSPPMLALSDALPKLAASDTPLLIGGESGTGKDLMARAVHSLSARASGPFVAVNCAALPESLIQSELFGHRKGAFTGAHRSKVGRFEASNGGTILLDEIGDLTVELQAILLHVLENRSFDVVGGPTIAVDVRIITATHVDLEAAVAAGTFREDLYYRLNVLNIELPPLSERGRDVQALAEYFFNKYTDESTAKRLVGFSADARVAMQRWHWPGNVRELRNKVKKAIVMCDRGPLTREDLGLERRYNVRGLMTIDEARDAAEVRAILNALDASGDKVSDAAQMLGVSRMTLYRLMRKHQFDSGLRDLVTNTQG
jgi:DNA-binding NtrC family response regulator